VWSANQRRRSLGERLFRIAETVERIESRPAELTHGAKALLAYIGSLLRQVDSTVDDRWNELAVIEPGLREELRRELCDDFRDVVGVLVSEVVPVLVGADARRVPVELEPALRQSVLSAAPDWKPVPVLYGSDYYEYSIVPLRKSELEVPVTGRPVPSSAAEGGDMESPPDFVFISVPGVERDSVALHAVLLGHEAGHLRDWYLRLSEGFVLDVPPQLVDSDGKPGEGYGEYVKIATNWTEECVADILSCLTIGPVALLALPEVAGGAGELAVDSDSHPGTDRRIELMLRVLHQQGFDVVSGLTEAFSGYKTLCGDAWKRIVQGPDLNQQIASLVLAWIRTQLDELIRVCTSNVPASDLFTSDYWPLVESAASMLGGGLPCGEIILAGRSRAAARPEVILNASWLVKVQGLQALGQQLGVVLTEDSHISDVSRVSEVLDRLTLKSFEIAEFLRSA
jgi:hypothetical protein